MTVSCFYVINFTSYHKRENGEETLKTKAKNFEIDMTRVSPGTVLIDNF